MDIRQSLAAQAYQPARLATQPTEPAAGDAFMRAATEFAETVAQGEIQARSAMSTGTDPQALVTALAQTELAVETAVTIRDRVVEAYQEILRMPV